MLNYSIKEGHFCLVPAFREENFISSWRMMLAAGLLYMAYTILRNLEIKTKLLKLSTKKTSPEKNNILGRRPGFSSLSNSRSYPQGPWDYPLCTAGYGFKTTRQCDQTPSPKKQKTKQAMKNSAERSARTDTSIRISKVTEKSACLRTYDNQLVYFICENKDSEIYIRDLTTEQEKDKVLLTYYCFQPSIESGDVVDGHRSIVSLSPEKHKRFLLHADTNDEEQSVKLQEVAESLPYQALFHLHVNSFPFVKFECKNNPGVYIGVKDNQLTLIKKEDETMEMNTVFKISRISDIPKI
ncbi:interleukin-33 isoform X1 [Sorex araneus]|uniref:interleukin-33 isoform X1 n=1 Tax=Sorex araneus TaxID=42254 RepID=UPI00243388EA|nr:interleukin-33 isoform X1 [Sorex araneus]